MARKPARTPRKPAAPPPQAARAQPRRPSGAPAVAAAGPVVRTDADYAAEYTHVRRDLTRIGMIAVVLIGVILAAPHVLK